VILLDVGESIARNGTQDLEKTVQFVTKLAQQQILLNGGELGIVLFGTQGTNNELEQDGYSNVTVLSPIRRPTVPMLRKIEDITPERANADCISSHVMKSNQISHVLTVFPNGITVITFSEIFGYFPVCVFLK